MISPQQKEHIQCSILLGFSRQQGKFLLEIKFLYLHCYQSFYVFSTKCEAGWFIYFSIQQVLIFCLTDHVGGVTGDKMIAGLKSDWLAMQCPNSCPENLDYTLHYRYGNPPGQ